MRSARDERVRAAAADVRDAADRTARGGEDRLRVAGLDGDRPDGAVVEALATEGADPRVAGVLGVVDPDAGLAAGAARVRLARSDVERPALLVVRIELDRGRVVVLEAVRHVLPLRRRVERLVRAPHSTVRVRDPEGALTVLTAVRVDRDVRDPPAEVWRSGVVDAAVAVLVVESLSVGRPERLPVALAATRPALDLLPVVERLLHRGGRNGVAGRRELQEFVIRTSHALLQAAGWREGRVRGELRRECGRKLLRLECRPGGARAAATTGHQPSDGDCRQQKGEDADGYQPTAHASLKHLSPLSRGRRCRHAPGTGLVAQALLEPRDDLRVDAPARPFRRIDEASSKLFGHAEQKAISLP